MATRKKPTTARKPSPRKAVLPKISDEAVESRTGRTWRQWFALLDKAGALRMSHKDIVAVLGKKDELSLWWQQMVAVTYEQAKGLRAKHEKPQGFEFSRSKTVGAPVGEVYEAWGIARKRAQWLPGAKLTIRKATENKTLRITWGDGTNLEVTFAPKGAARTVVVVQHGKLPSARAAVAQKAFWGDALDRLAQLLTA